MRNLVALVHRWRRDSVSVDRVFAALLLVGGLLEASLGGSAPDPTWVLLVATTIMTLTVAFRREYPATAGVTAGLVGAVVAALWGPPSTVTFGVAWLCALYGLSVWATPRRFAIGTAMIMAANLASTVGVLTLTVAGPFTVITALVMVLVHRIVTDREGRVRIAQRESNLAAREAVVEERARIARELHDVIAHDVSMIVVQAGAERRVLATADHSGDISSTLDVLSTIEHVGRDALTEMRRFVHLLRGEAPGESLTPQPGLDDVAVLVAQIRDAGIPVELRIDGDRRSLPIGIDLSAYRIVQEALTNTLKHAGPTRALVGIRYGTESLHIEISDDGSPIDQPRKNDGNQRRSDDPMAPDLAVNGGHGLVGMRERVLLYGGHFDAGYQSNGGFVVRAMLPIA